MTVSKSMLEDFKSNKIWRAIQEEYAVWLQDIHFQLEDHKQENTEKTFNRLAGNAETLHRAANVIEIMIQNLDQEEENNE